MALAWQSCRSRPPVDHFAPKNVRPGGSSLPFRESVAAVIEQPPCKHYVL
jgi:hypothetical protein